MNCLASTTSFPRTASSSSSWCLPWQSRWLSPANSEDTKVALVEDLVEDTKWLDTTVDLVEHTMVDLAENTKDLEDTMVDLVVDARASVDTMVALVVDARASVDITVDSADAKVMDSEVTRVELYSS